MTRKLLLLVGTLGICACSLFVLPAQATPPTCAFAYCRANPNADCQCPPNTPASPATASCFSWHADCNLL